MEADAWKDRRGVVSSGKGTADQWKGERAGAKLEP